MGFDNECILNIQSLPGEYFCPVCRTLVYPEEALQSQCTHLYCKPCLAYVVATTQACPYDGYLVTEADSKPLIELNKPLAETIGKVGVHCLYYRSGCQWQGTLSGCAAHGTECSFGSSLVVCNRCGAQIMHRQVQEHAQACPGLQPQAQQVESSQVQAATVVGQAATQDSTSAAAVSNATAAIAASTTVAATSSTTGAVAAPATAVAVPAAAGAGQPQAAAQAPTPEQWYQQQLQYQQYYQQYAGYNPYQQHYQQYVQYPQQVYQQYPQGYVQVPAQTVYQGQQPGQQPPVPYMVPQPQPQAQAVHPAQPQAQPQPQVQPQAQPQVQQQPVPQPQPQLQSQPQPQLQSQPQTQPQPQLQPHPQALPPHMQAQQVHAPAQQPQTYPPTHAQMPGQQIALLPQAHHPQYAQQPHQAALHPAHHQAVPPQQHPHPQMQPVQTHVQHLPPQQHHPQAQAHVQPQQQQPHVQLQPHPQSQAHPQPQANPQLQPQHPSAQAVTGHQSYPQPQPFQQFPPNVPQQRPMQMHPPHQGLPQQRPQHPGQMPNQFPSQQPLQMRPPQAQLPGQSQQLPIMMPPQGPTHQQTPNSVAQPGQPLHHRTGSHPPGHQHALPQQQMHGSVPGQPFQQGMLPTQHPMHPPQSLRPPAQQSHLLQSVPSAQGMATYQAHAIAGKPMIPNQAMPQQAFQQSSSAPMLLRPQPSHSTSQGSSIPVALLPPPGTGMNQVPASQAIPKSALSEGNLLDKADHMHELKPDTVPVIGDGSKVSTSASAELKSPKHITNSEVVGNEEIAIRNRKEQVNEPHNESGAVPGKGPGSPVNDEIVGEPGVKPITVQEASESQEGGPVATVGNKESEGETTRIPDRQVEGETGFISGGAETVNRPLDSNVVVQRESLDKTSERSDQAFVSQGQSKGILPSMQTLQQTPTPTGLVKGQLPQQAHVNIVPDQGRSAPQAGYHERNRHGPGPNEVQGMPSAGPVPGHDKFPLHHIPYGSSSDFPRPAMTSQRPPAFDRMFPPQVPPGQENRFQESHLQQVQLHGQMRPQGHNFPEGLPTSAASVPGPSGLPLRSFEQQAMPLQGHSQSHLPPSHDGGGRISHGAPVAPLMGGPQPGGFNAHSGMIARGSSFGPEYPVGQPRPTNSLEPEPYASKRLDYFDGRRPEPQQVPSVHIHGPPMDGQSSMMKMNGFSDKGPAGGLHSYGMIEEQQERLRASTQDPGRHTATQKEFEEDLKQFPRPGILDGEQISKFDPLLRSHDRTFGTDGGPRTLTSRPMPPYQSEGPFSAGGGGPSTFIPDGIGERHKPFGFQDDSLRKRDVLDGRPDFLRPISEFGRHHLDGLPSPRSPGRAYTGHPFSKYGLAGRSGNEEFGGRDLHGFGGRFRGFNFPLDAPGSSFHESRVSKHLGPGSSILPPYRRGDLGGSDTLQIDGPDVPRSHRLAGESFGYGVSSSSRSGDVLGSRNLPSLLRGGDSFGQGQIRMGEPTGFGGLHKHPRGGPGGLPSHLAINELVGGSNLPLHIRGSELGFGSSYHMHGGSSGDIDSFEYSRKRKPVSMGWCRICKIDCETVEGLDLHAQTREHQKMSMDLVLSIKKENAKKSKLNSGDGFSVEDSTKSKKANFENRENRQ